MRFLERSVAEESEGAVAPGTAATAAASSAVPATASSSSLMSLLLPSWLQPAAAGNSHTPAAAADAQPALEGCLDAARAALDDAAARLLAARDLHSIAALSRETGLALDGACARARHAAAAGGAWEAAAFAAAMVAAERCCREDAALVSSPNSGLGTEPCHVDRLRLGSVRDRAL